MKQESLRDSCRLKPAPKGQSQWRHAKRHPSTTVDRCTCEKGAAQGRSDTKCSGCQNNMRRVTKRRR
jgi:hypothetical protein